MGTKHRSERASDTWQVLIIDTQAQTAKYIKLRPFQQQGNCHLWLCYKTRNGLSLASLPTQLVADQFPSNCYCWTPKGRLYSCHGSDPRLFFAMQQCQDGGQCSQLLLGDGWEGIPVTRVSYNRLHLNKPYDRRGGGVDLILTKGSRPAPPWRQCTTVFLGLTNICCNRNRGGQCSQLLLQQCWEKVCAGCPAGETASCALNLFITHSQVQVSWFTLTLCKGHLL